MNKTTTAVNERLDAALAYAGLGWHVLPLWWVTAYGACACPKGANCEQKPGKHPLGTLVPIGLKNATTDTDLLTSWFRRFPHANIGVVCGEISGIVDVETDTKDDGETKLASI